MLDTINDLGLFPSDAKELAKLFDIYSNSKVVAFGSRVWGKARTFSDLDLAILLAEEDKDNLPVLREALSDSKIRINVDMHVWDNLHNGVKAKIMLKYVKETLI